MKYKIVKLKVEKVLVWRDEKVKKYTCLRGNKILKNKVSFIENVFEIEVDVWCKFEVKKNSLSISSARVLVLSRR